MPRESSADVRQHLIDAAIAQLAAEGMRGLTHRKVEARAGVSQGFTKYHFGSLDGLVVAVLRSLVDAGMATVMTPPDPDLPPDVQQLQWQQKARTAAAQLLSRPDLVRARYELYLYAANRPALQQVIRAARQEFIDRVAATLPSPDPEAGARMVLAMIDGLLLHQISAPESVIDDLAPALILATAVGTLNLPARG